MRSLRQKCSSLLFSASAREASERFQLSQELLLATASRWMSSAGPSSALISEEAVALAVQANRDALEDVLRSLETSVPGPSSRPSVVDWLDPTRHHDVSYSFKRYSELEQAAGRVSAALRGAKIRGGISPELADHISLLKPDQRRAVLETLGADARRAEPATPAEPGLYSVKVEVKSFEEDLADKAVQHLRLLSALADVREPSVEEGEVDRNLISVNKSPFKHKKHQEQWWMVTYRRTVTFECSTLRTTRFLLHCIRHSKLLGCQADVTFTHMGSLYPEKSSTDSAVPVAQSGSM